MPGDKDILQEDLDKQPNTAEAVDLEDVDFTEYDAEPEAKTEPERPGESGGSGEGAEGEEGPDDIDSEGMAEMIVEGLESLRVHFIVPAYEKTITAKIDPDVLNAMYSKLQNQGKNGSVTLTDAERRAAVIITKDIPEMQKKARYTSEQKGKYKARWTAMLRSLGWNVEMPPWAKLAWTALIVELPLIQPLLKARKMEVIREPEVTHE